MATLNNTVETAYTLLATGPTVENKTIEPVTGEVELVISESPPNESLRGHQRRGNMPMSISLKTGESLYGRASGTNAIIVVIT